MRVHLSHIVVGNAQQYVRSQGVYQRNPPSKKAHLHILETKKATFCRGERSTRTYGSRADTWKKATIDDCKKIPLCERCRHAAEALDAFDRNLLRLILERRPEILGR